jgi:hypothetical protein
MECMSRRAASSMVVRCERGKLVPATPYDAELLSQYKEDDELVCRLAPAGKGKPSLVSKYFATLGRLIDHTGASERWPTKDALSRHLMARFGHVKHFETTGGSVILEPLSPHEIPAKDFQAFYEQAMAVIGSEIVPGLDMHALCEERRIAYEEDDTL